MNQTRNPLNRFFGVILWPQTYLNLLYLLLAFPLGLFYFIFLVTGFSVGLALVIVWVGLLILPVVFLIWWVCAALERQLAISLLGEKIPPMEPAKPAEPGFWPAVKAYFSNPVTWKSLLYLFLKFPLGILSFVVLVTLGSVVLSFIAMPVIAIFTTPQVEIAGNIVWQIDTWWEALPLSLAGLVLLFPSLHILNGLAWISGRFAFWMLGYFQPRVPQPEIPQPLPPTPQIPQTPEIATTPLPPETPGTPEQPEQPGEGTSSSGSG